MREGSATCSIALSTGNSRPTSLIAASDTCLPTTEGDSPMHTLARINPFFAARFKRIAPAFQPQPRHEPEQTVYARLPRAPKNASPVPHLTSLYHFHRAGDYGDRSYPGNCGGNLIKDLLIYFKPTLLLDPM